MRAIRLGRTLLDSFEADAQAYIHMFAALGMKWSMAELKRYYSPNWHHVYRAARLRARIGKRPTGCG